MQNYILYQAYGSMDHINECRYSLLKYLQIYNLKPPAQTAVMIYTDQPAQFDAFSAFFQQFKMQEVNSRLIQQWRGNINFVHRVKIEVLKDFFSRHDGNLLYFDTDTYVHEPLEPLFNSIEKGTFYLHEYEGVINQTATPIFQKWNDFLQMHALQYNGKRVEVSADIKMWNAGVIGLNSNSRSLLDDILALTDTIYPLFPKHIAEQFSFSYCLQKAGTVEESDRQVAHYWNLKEFRKILNVFFKKNEEESIPNLVKLVHTLDAATILQQKNQYENLPLLKRWLNTLTGKSWSIHQYIKKLSH